MSFECTPYLNFDGNAREAMAFYQSILGGKLQISTFKEFNSSPDPSWDDKVMHSELNTDIGFRLYGADGRDPAIKEVVGLSLALMGDDTAGLTEAFNKLSAGGKVTQPLTPAPWGDVYGAFVDKYGINWMVNISPKR